RALHAEQHPDRERKRGKCGEQHGVGHARFSRKKRKGAGGALEEHAAAGTNSYVRYAASPCEVTSSPSRSSSSVTRRPIVRSTTLYASAATMPDHRIVTPTAFACVQTCAPMLSKPGFISNQLPGKPGPPSDGSLNTPVSSAPRIPPTACPPKTWSESSTFSMCFSPLTPHRQTNPAAKPMTNAPGIPTLPAAGVIATSPATAPEAAPSIDGLPLKIASPSVQARTAQAVAR